MSAAHSGYRSMSATTAKHRSGGAATLMCSVACSDTSTSSWPDRATPYASGSSRGPGPGSALHFRQGHGQPRSELVVVEGCHRALPRRPPHAPAQDVVGEEPADGVSDRGRGVRGADDEP